MIDFLLNCKRPERYDSNINIYSSISYQFSYLINQYFYYRYNDNISSRSINDTLKNIKSGHDNLENFITNYRNASLKTMKKAHLFSCQIIRNKWL